jgi:hypothetical protein
MSESADYYLSWLGCPAFGVGSTIRLRDPEPIAFVPTDLSGCYIWFDANNPDSITVDDKNGQSILEWANLGDLSANMVPNTGTGLYNVDTINTLPAVQFASGNNMFWYGELPNQPKTAFVVSTILSDLTTLAVPFVNLVNGDGAAGLQLGVSYSFPLFYYSLCQSGNWCNFVNGVNPYNTPQILGFRITADGSNNFISIDGGDQPLQETHPAAGFNTNPIPYTVNRTDGSSMDIGEIIIYNRELSNSEVLQVYNYLSDKWGISLHT